MTGVPPAPPGPSKISATPQPPKQGDPCKICYDFQPEDPDPITLRITWTLESGDDVSTVQVTREEPCVTVQVPADAIALLVEDLTDGSADYSSSVTS